MVRIIELLFSNKEYQRTETKQLNRIIELLTELRADTSNSARSQTLADPGQQHPQDSLPPD
jgi:hypothetical protein